MQSEKQYIDLYTEAQQLTKEHATPVLDKVRDKALEDFRQQGFPTKKVKRYKYMDIQKLFEPGYGLNPSHFEIPVNPYDTSKCDVPNLSTSFYFIVNGQFYNKSLPEAKLSDGVIIGSSNHVATECLELVAEYYGRLANTEVDAMTASNTMLAQDGLFIYVLKNVQSERTIQVINILRSDVDLMVNRRVLIVFEEGAKTQFLFCDHAVNDRNFLATQVIEAYVGANTNLESNCLEETHAKNVRASNVYIEQQHDSHASHNVITLHNGVTRSMLDLAFKEESSECFCSGCVTADKSQHVDSNTLIDHQVPHCTSNELCKYVLDDNTAGAFAGRALVRKGAQKTLSQEDNRNLCASKTARMFTQPMLEIYADDIQCDHGSTVGQLNDAALFYMQQRGIDKKEAKLLLEFAFVNEVIDRMEPEPSRDCLHYLVEKRFRGKLDKCEGCDLYK